MSIYRTRNGDISSSIKNSLTDILPNKSADSLERTKFQQSQNASLVKAINSIECPIKEKHVRNIILGTFYEKSALPFWYNALKLQLYGNPITCWKFCYTLHKILRDGYSSTVDDSYRYVNTLEDLSKSWIHLKQDYGNLLYRYCDYLSFKIKFHKKNQFIPSNLLIDDKDLNELASNDINNYFQLCCEFFDYADEILALQNAVFVTMDRNRSNSMTADGQCKLAPLVLCIQESNQLYDFCVQFLFKLHDNLPGEILEGHRERFLTMFKQLTKFYECCKNLQYFKNLISIPDLPLNPPNFRQKSDFNSYIKPVMVVVEQPLSETSSNHDDDSLLVDFSDTSQQQQSPPTSPANDALSLQQQQQQQQYLYTQQLLQEIERLRSELDRLRINSEIDIRTLRERIKQLQDELMANKSELEQQRIKNANLEEQLKISNETAKAKADLENLEKKAVSSEEKFIKMKELYTKLKDEHVNLLRQDADVKKQKASLTETCEHAKKMKAELEKRLEDEVKEKHQLEQNLKDYLNEIQTLKSESEKSQANLFSSNQKYQDELQSLKNSKANLETELAELSKKFTDLDLSVSNHKSFRQSIYFGTLAHCESIIKDSLVLFDDGVLLNCKSGAEYLLMQLQPFHNNLSDLLTSYSLFKSHSNNPPEKDFENFINLLKYLNKFSSLVYETVISGKITSLTAAALQQGEVLADACRNCGQQTLKLIDKMKLIDDLTNADEVQQLGSTMDKILATLKELLPKVHDINKEELGDLIDQEMHKTSEAIEAAVAKLEALMNKTKEKDTGIKLEVNDKILDSCTALMKAIKILIIKAKELQREIVAQGRGASSVKEFYAKNHKWTEGLVTAAKLVGLGANVLIEKADKFVNGNGKLEEIIVSSNEIAASTAQLVVASNVKADRESTNRYALIEAKNSVSNATAGLVASAKSYLQISDEQNSMDFTKLSLHQTKRLEMEAQVKVLELEKLLENEKNKLYKLRKQHYVLEPQTE